MTSRLPIGEAIEAWMRASNAALEFYILNGREATAAELVEFKPKYIEAVKVGLYDVEDDE